jgi:hypothetical protein
LKTKQRRIIKSEKYRFNLKATGVKEPKIKQLFLKMEFLISQAFFKIND